MVRALLSSMVGQLLIALLGLAIVSACSLEAGTKPAPAANLHKTNWLLKTLDGANVNSERPLSLQFDGGRLNGYAGCNSIFGNYTASNDGVFSVGSIGSTKMACIGERDQLEHTYLQRLAQASQYAVVRDQLHLLDGQRKILLVFTAEPPRNNPKTPL